MTATATAPEVRRDDNHVYWRGPLRKSGVSEILRPHFPPSPYYTEEGRAEGQALHEACALRNRGPLDFAHLATVWPAKLVLRARAVDRFYSETGFKAEAIERIVYDPTLDYAGTLDACGLLLGRYTVVDWKRGGPLPQQRLQTAAYKRAGVSCGLPIEARCTVHLNDDGKYKLVWHDDAGDEKRWAAIVSAHHAISHYR
jgi:hypothetical protein